MWPPSSIALGELKIGSKVALERALLAHTRFGGHFVQGHIDSTVTIASREADHNSLRILFKVPSPLSASAPHPTIPSLNQNQPPNIPIMPYIIPKGFIALDGASLTITTVDDRERTFGIMLIAHTQSKIELGNKQVGERVNVEVDMVGKYVEKGVLAALGGEEDSPLRTMVEGVVEGVLRKHRLLN
jgi:riboflavin synthase